ncbi:MAG TPA: hypothetical protein VMF58_11155 [Rhizomicrobium sp.]|nr:hypothetical protein [Rhizomicrobium sp.]
MQTQTLLRLGGVAAIAGGAMRLGEPLLKRTLTGNALQLSYFAIDVFLLLGLIAWYAWRAEKLGIAGLIGFISGTVGIMIIRSAALFAPQGYVLGATLLLLGLVVMNLPALIRWERPICPPLLWLAAFVLGLGSLAYYPLALVAGVVFGIGYIFAGVSLLRA